MKKTLSLDRFESAIKRLKIKQDKSKFTHVNSRKGKIKIHLNKRGSLQISLHTFCITRFPRRRLFECCRILYMICDPLSGLETTIYTKKLDGEPPTTWSTLLPSWTTTCPTFSTKRKPLPCLKSCFLPFCLSSMRNCFALSKLQLCVLGLMFCRSFRKLFDSCKVIGQTNVHHNKWAYENSYIFFNL